MLGKEDLRRLIDYTVWANHRLVRGAATLTNDEFRRDLGSSHGGVRGTLVHMMWAELIWLERWKGLPNPPKMDEGEFPDVMAVRERWGVVESHREGWLGGLTEGDAAAVVHYKTTDGKAFDAPLWKLVQHAVNHATYHRGQVTSFMRILGAKPVSTDLLIWDREQG